MRFEEIYERRLGRHIIVSEAADILGVHERIFRRWAQKYKEHGIAGLYDPLLGKAAHNCAPVDEVLKMLTLYQTKYFDFNVKHFHKKLKACHDYSRSYNWTKNQLQKAGVISKQKSSGKHRMKRPRKSLPSMMLH